MKEVLNVCHLLPRLAAVSIHCEEEKAIESSVHGNTVGTGGQAFLVLFKIMHVFLICISVSVKGTRELWLTSRLKKKIHNAWEQNVAFCWRPPSHSLAVSGFGVFFWSFSEERGYTLIL